MNDLDICSGFFRQCFVLLHTLLLSVFCRMSQPQSNVADLSVMWRCWKSLTWCHRMHLCIEYISAPPESQFAFHLGKTCRSYFFNPERETFGCSWCLKTSVELRWTLRLGSGWVPYQRAAVGTFSSSMTDVQGDWKSSFFSMPLATYLVTWNIFVLQNHFHCSVLRDENQDSM